MFTVSQSTRAAQTSQSAAEATGRLTKPSTTCGVEMVGRMWGRNGKPDQEFKRKEKQKNFVVKVSARHCRCAAAAVHARCMHGRPPKRQSICDDECAGVVNITL